MRYVLSNSTAILTYAPPDDTASVALVLKDEAGATVHSAASADVTVPSTTLPSTLDYQRLEAVWDITATDGSKRRDIQYVEVRPFDTQALVYHRQARDAIGLELGVDDGIVASVVDAASVAIREMLPRITMPPVTETRRVLTDGLTVFLDECSAVTAVLDPDGNALTYTTVYHDDGSVRWLELDRKVDGQVSVTGTFGSHATPADIAQAVLVTVRTWYTLDRGAFAVNLDGSTGFVEWRPAIPTRAIGLLSQHRSVRL